MNQKIEKILNRHQMIWVYLTFAAGVSGFTSGRILAESVPLSILIFLNAVTVTLLCNQIENKTLNRDYMSITGKKLSPLQAYVYLKSERYWVATATIILVASTLVSFFVRPYGFAMIFVAVACLLSSFAMWKLYEPTVYTEMLVDQEPQSQQQT